MVTYNFNIEKAPTAPCGHGGRDTFGNPTYRTHIVTQYEYSQYECTVHITCNCGKVVKVPESSLEDKSFKAFKPYGTHEIIAWLEDMTLSDEEKKKIYTEVKSG